MEKIEGSPLFDPRVSRELYDRTEARRYDISEELIYHHCSAETLLVILESKTLRFSDANCLNDGEEIIWGERQVAFAIQRIIDREGVRKETPPIPKKFADWFRNAWQSLKESSRHFLACFSTDGDSLSQWRAYADDARGFSIGFCPNNLDLPANFYSIIYEIELQQQDIIDHISIMIKKYEEDHEYLNDQGLSDIIHFFYMSCSYKNPAFQDEREVRAVHAVNIERSKEGRRRLEFIGGQVADVMIEDAKIDYRSSKGRLIPFIDFKFQIFDESPIREIWLGPRCETGVEDLTTLLHTLGYFDVDVKQAGSRYR